MKEESQRWSKIESCFCLPSSFEIVRGTHLGKPLAPPVIIRALPPLKSSSSPDGRLLDASSLSLRSLWRNPTSTFLSTPNQVTSPISLGKIGTSLHEEEVANVWEDGSVARRFVGNRKRRGGEGLSILPWRTLQVRRRWKKDVDQCQCC